MRGKVTASNVASQATSSPSASASSRPRRRRIRRDDRCRRRARTTSTLTVSLFGDFGYHDLYKQYEASHPGVTIKEDIQDYADHHSKLAQHLATGAGAADIEAIEVGFIAQFAAQPQQFVNLRQYGAASAEGPLAAVEVAAGRRAATGAVDRSRHRRRQPRDLLPHGPVPKAGLPTSRDAVSKLWPTWQAFIDTGKQFQAKAPKGVKFVDSGSNVYNAIIAQRRTRRTTTQSGKVIVSDQPEGQGRLGPDDAGDRDRRVRRPRGLQQRLEHRLQEGHVRDRHLPGVDDGLHPGPGARRTKGKWDIAAVPGGGGNWGGSFLAVPKQSKHHAERGRARRSS